jgi:hypothetical protein
MWSFFALFLTLASLNSHVYTIENVPKGFDEAMRMQQVQQEIIGAAQETDPSEARHQSTITQHNAKSVKDQFLVDGKSIPEGIFFLFFIVWTSDLVRFFSKF